MLKEPKRIIAEEPTAQEYSPNVEFTFSFKPSKVAINSQEKTYI